MAFRLAALVVIVLTLNGCAGGPGDPNVSSRRRPCADRRQSHPGPAKTVRARTQFRGAQLVTARYGERTFVFEGHLSAAPDRFLLVGLDPMGHRALSITWTDRGIAMERESWLPEQLRPDNILADIVILYWPEDSVARALARSGAKLTSGPGERSIWFEGKEIIHADYRAAGADIWNGGATYRNLAWGYQLDIQSEIVQ